jgi:hypothetical protein
MFLREAAEIEGRENLSEAIEILELTLFLRGMCSHTKEKILGLLSFAYSESKG